MHMRLQKVRTEDEEGGSHFRAVLSQQEVGILAGRLLVLGVPKVPLQKVRLLRLAAGAQQPLPSSQMKLPSLPHVEVLHRSQDAAVKS